MTRDDIVQLILTERARQFNLPGREFDVTNSPNDWVAISGYYLHEETRRGAVKPSCDGFADSLIKAAAVILAALEHCPMMTKNDHFSSE